MGAEIALMVAVDAPVLLTGRSPGRGQALAAGLGGEARAWDLADPAPFRADGRAVISSGQRPG